MKLKTENNKLFIGKKIIQIDYEIISAYKIKNKVIICFKTPIPKGRFQNLICMNIKEDIIWKADLPSHDSVDCYWSIQRVWPSLVVISFSSYKCKINVNTGKIMNKKYIFK